MVIDTMRSSPRSARSFASVAPARLIRPEHLNKEIVMKKSLFSITAASILAAGMGVASAQSSTSTTTTWTPDQGSTITQYSTTQHYSSFSDPALKPSIGEALPGTVTLYPLPDTIKIDRPDQYSYSIVNNNPVVVERTTRKVVHTWP
jgi:hypothetical protein